MTGASEGIGRCFALDLAKSGFNIVLASRSIGKLEKVQEEIVKEYPNCKVKCVPVDFGKTFDYSSITGDEEVMSNLGMLVNNVG